MGKRFLLTIMLLLQAIIGGCGGDNSTTAPLTLSPISVAATTDSDVTLSVIGGMAPYSISVDHTGFVTLSAQSLLSSGEIILTPTAILKNTVDMASKLFGSPRSATVRVTVIDNVGATSTSTITLSNTAIGNMGNANGNQ